MSINLEFTPEIQSKTDELYKKIQGTIPKIENRTASFCCVSLF